MLVAPVLPGRFCNLAALVVELISGRPFDNEKQTE
jgi:hypothetical protein